ncbi:MAG: hypothetical protein ACJAU0_000763 [Flavobacteriales bacterium]|jgi:hypothetical protein
MHNVSSLWRRDIGYFLLTLETQILKLIRMKKHEYLILCIASRINNAQKSSRHFHSGRKFLNFYPSLIGMDLKLFGTLYWGTLSPFFSPELMPVAKVRKLLVFHRNRSSYLSLFLLHTLLIIFD